MTPPGLLPSPSPSKPPRNPALRQVRRATGKSQGALAHLLGFSTVYVQAVELGQRSASRELAQALSDHTGAWPECILKCWDHAVDWRGEFYTPESYREFLTKRAEPPDPKAVAQLLDSTRVVLDVVGKIGKSTLALSILRDKLGEFTKRVLVIDGVAEGIAAQVNTVGRITYGDLRGNEALARIVGFVDDESRGDQEEVLLARHDENPVNPKELVNRLFPDPAQEEIRRKYLAQRKAFKKQRKS